MWITINKHPRGFLNNPYKEFASLLKVHPRDLSCIAQECEIRKSFENLFFYSSSKISLSWLNCFEDFQDFVIGKVDLKNNKCLLIQNKLGYSLLLGIKEGIGKEEIKPKEVD